MYCPLASPLRMRHTQTTQIKKAVQIAGKVKIYVFLSSSEYCEVPVFYTSILSKEHIIKLLLGEQVHCSLPLPFVTHSALDCWVGPIPAIYIGLATSHILFPLVLRDGHNVG